MVDAGGSSGQSSRHRVWLTRAADRSSASATAARRDWPTSSRRLPRCPSRIARLRSGSMPSLRRLPRNSTRGPGTRCPRMSRMQERPLLPARGEVRHEVRDAWLHGRGEPRRGRFLAYLLSAEGTDFSRRGEDCRAREESRELIQEPTDDFYPWQHEGLAPDLPVGCSETRLRARSRSGLVLLVALRVRSVSRRRPRRARRDARDSPAIPDRRLAREAIGDPSEVVAPRDLNDAVVVRPRIRVESHGVFRLT
jgi:hypothetical protein